MRSIDLPLRRVARCCAWLLVLPALAARADAEPAPPTGRPLSPASQASPAGSPASVPASTHGVKLVSVRDLLRAAIGHYQRSEFEQARRILGDLVEHVGEDRTREAQQVHTYLAFVRVAFGETEAAVSTLERALDIDPDMVLPEHSPKIRKVFEQARARQRAKTRALDHDPPLLRHRVPGKARYGRGVPISVEVRDRSGVERVVLNYRTAGERGFAAVTMEHQRPRRYLASIPRLVVARPAVEYYIAAWDALGNGPGLKGSPSAPITVAVEGGPRSGEALSRGRPWYRKWWVWALIGGAIATAGGVTAGVVASRSQNARVDIRLDPALDPVGAAP